MEPAIAEYKETLTILLNAVGLRTCIANSDIDSLTDSLCFLLKSTLGDIAPYKVWNNTRDKPSAKHCKNQEFLVFQRHFTNKIWFDLISKLRNILCKVTVYHWWNEVLVDTLLRCPQQAPAILWPQLQAAAATIEVENRLHSGLMSPIT